jgi:hypothetical protein
MGRPVESVSSDFTLGISDLFSGDIFINPGAAINITLPDSCEDVDVIIWNIGATFTITIKKPDTSTLYTLVAGDQVNIKTYLDTSSVPQYEAFAMMNLASLITMEVV